MTGCINTSLPAKDSVFDNCRLSAEEHNLQHEVLGPEEVAARFPGYRLPPGFKERTAPGLCLCRFTKITCFCQGDYVLVCKASLVPGLDMLPSGAPSMLGVSCCGNSAEREAGPRSAHIAPG